MTQADKSSCTKCAGEGWVEDAVSLAPRKCYACAGFGVVETPCSHTDTVMSCGIRVCFDCGEPLNAKAKRLVGGAA